MDMHFDKCHTRCEQTERELWMSVVMLTILWYVPRDPCVKERSDIAMRAFGFASPSIRRLF